MRFAVLDANNAIINVIEADDPNVFPGLIPDPDVKAHIGGSWNGAFVLPPEMQAVHDALRASAVKTAVL